MKVCNRCERELPLDRFYVTRRDGDGIPLSRRGMCIDCQRDTARKWKPSEDLKTLGPDTRLRVAPFRDWCIRRMEEDEVGVGAFAARIGMPERRLNDHLAGRSSRIASRTVDRALTRDGGWHISQLYPSLYPGAPQAVIDLLQHVADCERIEAWETEHRNQEGKVAA